MIKELPKSEITNYLMSTQIPCKWRYKGTTGYWYSGHAIACIRLPTLSGSYKYTEIYLVQAIRPDNESDGFYQEWVSEYNIRLNKE